VKAFRFKLWHLLAITWASTIFYCLLFYRVGFSARFTLVLALISLANVSLVTWAAFRFGRWLNSRTRQNSPVANGSGTGAIPETGEAVARNESETVASPDMEATARRLGEDRTRRLWASWLFFIVGGLDLAWLLFARAEGFSLRDETLTAAAMIWSFILALGLRRGGNGWRLFVCFSAEIGILKGFEQSSFGSAGRSDLCLGLSSATVCIGILILLWGDNATSRRRKIGAALVLGALVATVAVLMFATILPEYRTRATIRAYALPAEIVSDSTLGYSIRIPSGWTVLKRDNPLLKFPRAKMVAADLRNSTFAVFLVEPADVRIQSVDDYFDRAQEAFKQNGAAQFLELGRTDVTIDGKPARKLEAVWQQSGGEFYGMWLAARRGLFYYSLLGFSGKDFESRAQGSLANLQQAISLSPGPPP
jgi:hypothetical protein